MPHHIFTAQTLCPPTAVRRDERLSFTEGWCLVAGREDDPFEAMPRSLRNRPQPDADATLTSHNIHTIWCVEYLKTLNIVLTAPLCQIGTRAPVCFFHGANGAAPPKNLFGQVSETRYKIGKSTGLSPTNRTLRTQARNP